MLFYRPAVCSNSCFIPNTFTFFILTVQHSSFNYIFLLLKSKTNGLINYNSIQQNYQNTSIYSQPKALSPQLYFIAFRIFFEQLSCFWLVFSSDVLLLTSLTTCRRYCFCSSSRVTLYVYVQLCHHTESPLGTIIGHF